MKKKLLLIIPIGILIVTIATFLTFDQFIKTNTLEEGTSVFVDRGSVTDNSPAPDFALPDILDNQIKLSEFYGRVVIINFWTTWCIPCKQEMPVLDEISRINYDNIVVIGVNVGESVEKVKSFVNEVGVAYPILIDAKGLVGITYHVNGYPTTYFVDAAGIIRGKYVGLMTPRLIEQYLLPLGINQ